MTSEKPVKLPSALFDKDFEKKAKEELKKQITVLRKAKREKK